MNDLNTTLFTDEWLTVVAAPERFTVTWLNKAARLAVVHVCFIQLENHHGQPPSRRAKTGKALVGPDGGTWLTCPGFEVPRSRFAGVASAALDFAVEYIDSAPRLLARVREATGDPHASTGIVIPNDGSPCTWCVGGQVTFTAGLDLSEVLRRHAAGETNPPPKTYGEGATEIAALYDALARAHKGAPI
jgi:hypothetical protein